MSAPVTDLMGSSRCQSQSHQPREYPPLLTTWLTRRDPNGLFPTWQRHLTIFRRGSSSRGGRVIMEARDQTPQIRYYMKTQRSDGRLTITMTNLNPPSEYNSAHGGSSSASFSQFDQSGCSASSYNQHNQEVQPNLGESSQA